MNLKLVTLTIFLILNVPPLFLQSSQVITDTIVVINQDSVKGDDIHLGVDNTKNIPSPTSWWQWILFGVFGASSFGMLINKRIAGYIVFAIVLYFVVKDFRVAIEMGYPIWPFILLIAWILLTGGLAKTANRETLERAPWLKGKDKK